MQKFILTLVLCCGFFSISFAQDAILVWNGHKNDEKVDTSCFRKPIKGDKNGMDVEVTQFRISFSNSKNEHFSFTIHGDKLTDEVTRKIISLPDKSLTLYFNDIKGLGSTGLSYYTFNGKVVLEK